MVTADIINNSNVRYVYGRIKALHESVPGDLSPDLLALDIEAQFVKTPDRAQEIIESVIQPVGEAPLLDMDQIKPVIKKYVQREILARTAKDIATSLDDEALDASLHHAVLSRALEITDRLASLPLHIIEASLPGESEYRDGLCSLGLTSKLDTVIGGGIANGELVVFMAPPARGKTSLLVKVGAEAAKSGKAVLHITLEINRNKVVRRYDQALTGFDRDEICANPKTIIGARKAIYANGGSVQVQDWSYKEITPHDIRSMVQRIRMGGGRVDLLLIDYLQLMSPNKRASNRQMDRRHAYGQLGIDIRALAVECNIPVVTAWQVNRAGSSKNMITEADIAECWDIIMHSDIILSLNQSDAERNEKYMRIGVVKQRESMERPAIDFHCDLDRMKIVAMDEYVD